jgi:hypothetical protein
MNPTESLAKGKKDCRPQWTDKAPRLQDSSPRLRSVSRSTGWALVPDLVGGATMARSRAARHHGIVSLTIVDSRAYVGWRLELSLDVLGEAATLNPCILPAWPACWKRGFRSPLRHRLTPRGILTASVSVRKFWFQRAGDLCAGRNELVLVRCGTAPR